MRIFYSFLIVLVSAILILLPVSAGVYDFKTDLREDVFSVSTAPGVTTATVQLFKTLYDNDTSTISVLSHDYADIPVPDLASYDNVTRALPISGLAGNTTRLLTVTYTVEAFDSSALTMFLSIVPMVWILMWIALPVAGIVAIWMGKA